MNEDIKEAIEAIETLNYKIYDIGGPHAPLLSLSTDGDDILILLGEFTLNHREGEVRRYNETTDEYEPFVDAIIREIKNLRTQLQQVVDCISGEGAGGDVA